MVTQLNSGEGAASPGRRVRIDYGQGETVLHLTPRRHLGQILVNAIILAGGLFGLGFGLLLLGVGTLGAPGFMQLWLVIWSVGVLWMLINFLWPLLGRETWIATAQALTRKTSILGLGPKMTYASKELSGLRFIHDDPLRSVTVNGHRVRQPALEFHVNGRAVSFAHGISRADAEQVISAFLQRLHLARGRHK